MKNQIKSYLKLKINVHNHTFWISRAIMKKAKNVIVNNKINWIINFGLKFLINRDREILSAFSLFFIADIQCFRFVKIYMMRIAMKTNNIISFQIQTKVRNFPFRPSLNVMNVCKKNCNRSHITKILHNIQTR